MTAQNQVNGYGTVSQQQFLFSQPCSEKKQKTELAHLATLLQVVEQDIAKAQSASAGASSADTQNSFVPALQQAMAQMTAFLQNLQVKIVQFQNQISAFDAEAARAEVIATQANLKAVQKQVQKIYKKQEDQKILGIFTKVLESVIGVVMAVLAVVLVQPELLFMAAMTFASAAGLTQEATNGIASLLQDMGVPEEVAQIVAAVLVTVVVIVVSIAAAPAATANAAGEAVAVSEDVANAAEEISSAGAKIVQGLKTAASKIGGFIKTVNLFNRLTPAQNLVLMSTTQALMQTGLLSDLAKVSTKKSSAEEQEKIQMVVEIIGSIAALLVTLGASAGAVAGTEQEVQSAVNASKFQGLLNRASQNIKNMVGSLSQLVKTTNIIRQGATAAEFAVAMSTGIVGVVQGKLEETLGAINADLTLVQAASNMNSDETSSDGRHAADILQAQSRGNLSFLHLADGYAGFTNAMITLTPA